jgi:hypothetical protein
MEDLIRALPKLLQIAGDVEEVAESAAKIAWRRASGESLRRHAVPFRLYRKTLVISVADSTWQQQLEAMSGQLLFRLNSLLGQAMVTFLEFRIDPKTVQAERASLESRPTGTPAGKQRALVSASGKVLSAAQAIHDEDLRNRFLLAAGSCIDRYENRSQAGKTVIGEKPLVADV